MSKLSRANQKLLMVSLFTIFMGFILAYYQQFAMAILGVVVGWLRILLFWNSEEGEPFIQQEIQRPKPKRQAEQQAKLEVVYEKYEAHYQKESWLKKPPQLLFLLVIGLLVIAFDRRMIFYTFFMTMVITWMWFQWWLAWQSGK